MYRACANLYGPYFSFFFSSMHLVHQEVLSTVTGSKNTFFFRLERIHQVKIDRGNNIYLFTRTIGVVSIDQIHPRSESGAGQSHNPRKPVSTYEVGLSRVSPAVISFRRVVHPSAPQNGGNHARDAWALSHGRKADRLSQEE